MTALTDTNQTTIATYNYEAFGNIISDTIIIYDNNIGTNNTEDTATILGGGNIVVHKN